MDLLIDPTFYFINNTNKTQNIVWEIIGTDVYNHTIIPIQNNKGSISLPPNSKGQSTFDWIVNTQDLCINTVGVIATDDTGNQNIAGYIQTIRYDDDISLKAMNLYCVIFDDLISVYVSIDNSILQSDTSLTSLLIVVLVLCVVIIILFIFYFFFSGNFFKSTKKRGTTSLKKKKVVSDQKSPPLILSLPQIN